MIVGTMFTLFVVPVFYSLIASQHRAEEETEPAESHPALPAGATPAIGLA
jgi:multidrug efflux pump